MDELGSWMIKDIDGKGQMPVWEQHLHEGILITISNYFAHARKHQFMSWKKLSEMKEHERRNMRKFAYDLAMFAILYTLYTGLGDDDEYKKYKKEPRILRVFKYSALDMVAYTPWQMTETLGSVPLFDNFERFSNLFLGDFSEIKKLVPGSASVQVLAETMSSEIE
jgi:hypothetical protein